MKNDRRNHKTPQAGRNPQDEQHRGADPRDANQQNANARNAGQKDGATPQGGRQSRQGNEQSPPKSGNRQVDLKPGSADAGVHGGEQPTDLQQGSQRQKEDLQGRAPLPRSDRDVC